MDPEATRNTSLANERTYLAWWRTGLASLAVALAVARIVPDLAKTHPRWPYTLIGIGFALIGLVQMVYAEHRRRAIEAAVLADGEVGPPNRTLTFVITGASVVLALAILVLLFSGD
ncbi:MAG: DUF202 domain-containing protein [Solirubrobacteraceae bacterium]